MFNITFTLGDPSCDGHCQSKDYHIECNYSIEDISNAYLRMTKRLGFDFVKEIGAEYECPWWIPPKYTEILLKYNLISEEYVNKEDDKYTPAGAYEFYDARNEFVEIFFNIVKIELSDLIWKHRDLKEQTLHVLEGAAYGFFYV